MKKLHGKRKYTLSLLTVFSLFIQLFVPFFSTSVNAVGSEEQVRDENGVILVNDNNTYENTEFHKDNLFGIAGGFHLVGLDTVDKKAHIHGNILANNFINDGDFGTRDKKEVSYLRNITGGTVSAGADKNSILVVGKDTTIGTVDNGNAWSINGNKVERPNKQNSPDSLWQDNDAEFIDFEQVEQQSKTLASRLAALENNATTIDADDMNKQEIIVTEDSDYNVYNLQDGDFDFTAPIHIKGFNKNSPQTLIINIDMKGKSDFSIPNSVASYTDGSKVSTGEVNEWSNANVVWNVYDSGASDNVYTGAIKNTGAVTGSILSPGATITLDHNLNGTVIGKKIVVNGETHRDDYVPPTPTESETTSVDVEKEWIGEAQDSVTVNLLADGKKVDSVELSAGNDWKHTFEDLPVVHDIEDEEAIEYTVEEIEVDGYESSIAGSAALGFVITNTEDPEPEKPTDPEPEEPTDPEPEKPTDPEPEEPTDPEPEEPTDPEPEEPAEPEDKLPQTGEAINILAPFGIILIIMGLGTLISKRYIKE